MVSISRIFASALMAASALATLTGPQIVTAINEITTQSQNLQGPANSINLLSGPLFLIGQGPFPTIIVGFTQIVNEVTDDAQGLQGTNTLSDKDATAVFDAFRTFVEVHQELLSILIGKAGILNDLPLVGPPVAQVLRALESIVDTFAYALIDVAQSESAKLTKQLNALDGTINQAITAYTPSYEKRSYPIRIEARAA